MPFSPPPPVSSHAPTLSSSGVHTRGIFRGEDGLYRAYDGRQAAPLATVWLDEGVRDARTLTRIQEWLDVVSPALRRA